eukprot:TRINITY_DN14919_c0_g1_i1.p1 TRINITY_DN14919_c0_g1~~TRINITY_DN14919_c0_g1_i1.p1  ORF type:complete len:186 (+),score=13.10 TRINITY_DN14919_c0_g1_i1:102-659(+)
MVKPPNYWKNIQNQRSFLESLASRRGFQQWQDWYSISKKDFVENGGKALLEYHNHSPSKAIMYVFPQHDWKVERFAIVPRNHWLSPANRRRFMNHVARRLKIQDMNDWNHVKLKDIVRLGGSGLLNHFGNSLSSLLNTVFPEYEWKEKKERHPVGYWQDPAHQRKFLDNFATSHNITDMEGRTAI